MRDDRFKPSQFSRTKTNSPSHFRPSIQRENGLSRTSMLQQLQLLAKNGASIAAKIDKQSFNNKYERALKLINQNTDLSSKNALTILNHLCAEIQKLPDNHQIPNDLLEKVVINCWRLKNRFKEVQIEYRRQCLHFIRHYISFLDDNYKRRQIHKHGLEMLYLIQANEQYEEKLYKESLQSCEQSLKNCRGTKNQPHFLKVHYLKSKIYAVQKNLELQLAEIKKCIIYLNNLSAANLTDGGQRQYLQKLKKVVEDRKQTLLELGSDKKQVLDMHKQASAPKFRRRSISLKKVTSEKNFVTPIPNSPRATPPKNKVVHIKSISTSKQPFSNQIRKEFLPLDINKKCEKTKLKKKPLKICDAIDTVMDDIEYTALNFNHEDLLLPRPRQKKLESEVPTEGPTTNQRQEPDIQKQISSNKQLNESQQSMIQPVTHLNNLNAQQKQDSPEHEEEILVRKCVKQSEENLFRLFAKMHFKKEQVHETITFEENSLEGQEILLDLQSELVLKHQQTSCHEQFYFEQKVFTNQDVHVDDQTQLCTYYGVLSQFWFSIKMERMEHTNNNGQIYKVLHIDFRAVLDQIWNVNASLPYFFYNTYERNLELIFDQIIQREHSDSNNELQTIKDKLFSLISNRLIIVKKANGIVLTPKNPIHNNKNNLAAAYREQLRNRLLIFELNNLTKDYHKYRIHSNLVVQRKDKEEVNLQNINSNPHKDSDSPSDCQDVLNFYLPKLIEILSEDLRSENPSLSSMKRFKTQKFQKDNLLSYTTNLIKIKQQSDVNTRLIYEDTMSQNLVIMPSDFNTKISNFFEHYEDSPETSIPEFYYCMKFLLIKPLSVRLSDTLFNFYDRLSVRYLHKLKNNLSVSLEMSCYKIKDIFRHKQSQIFFKFEVLFQGEKMKMMKFIATSEDIRLIENNVKVLETHRQMEKSLKNTRKNSARAIVKQPLENKVATQSTMLNLLKSLAPNIIVKKNYIYSVIGFETEDPYFCFINKFRLEGKTTQNRNFMIPHLKYIHILLQKSIKMQCEHLKEYAVVTVRQITKSIEFNLIFYLPKLQKTYSVNLQRKVIKYLNRSQLATIFENQQLTTKQIEELFFTASDDPAKKKYQGQIWSRFVSIFKFETKHYEDNTIVLLKIGSYTAFLKDSSFSEYFELKRKIFHLEMSVSKKSGLLTPTNNSKNKILSSSKRKSSSSKDIINNVNQSLNGFIKRSVGRVLKKSIEKRPSQPIVFRKPEVFQRLNQVFESDANKYILYLSLTQVHQIKNNKCEPTMLETEKINYSFYLSDLICLLKDTKKELSNQEQKINNQFNEEKFSFAILLRAMTIIKYRIIEQLKQVQVQSLFEGSKRILNQKIFKNTLNSVLNSQTDSAYSLNACKRLHLQQKNVYLIYRNIMNVSKSIMVSIFYEQKSEKMTFVITNNHELTNRQKCYEIGSMHFPWIEMYKKEQLFKINSRIYKYYQNVLRLV